MSDWWLQLLDSSFLSAPSALFSVLVYIAFPLLDQETIILFLDGGNQDHIVWVNYRVCVCVCKVDAALVPAPRVTGCCGG